MTQKKVSIFMGGTGANSAAEARDALGVLANTGGTITGNLNVANTLLVSGNVAFGTNTPYTASGHTYLTIDNAINGGGLVLQRNSSPAFLATVDATSVYLDSPTSLPIRFFIGVTEAARIDSNGNVGIGVTSPETKLDINGVVRFRNGTLTGSGFVEMASVSGVGLTMQSFSYVFKNSTNTAEFLRITSAGNVGIGTTTPTAPLQIVADGQGSVGILNLKGNNSHLGLANTSGTFRGWYGYFNASVHGSEADLNIKTGYNGASNIRMSADGDGTAAQVYIAGSTGNVGIGTTSPGYKLDVVGSSASFQARFGTATTNFGIFVNDASNFVSCGSITNDQLRLFTNGIDRATITSNGIVGIGTTDPSTYTNLHVEGNKILIRSASSNWSQLQIANPNDGESTITIAAGGTGSPGNDSTYTRQWVMGINPWSTGVANFAITNKTLTTTPPFLITDAGYITSPYQPSFFAHGHGQTKASGWQKIECFGTVERNVGSGFNVSTQRFTAPIAGMYAISFGGYTPNNYNGNRYGFSLTKNGAGDNFISGGEFAPVDGPLSVHTQIIYLNQNDYVEARMYTPIEVVLGAGYHPMWFQGIFLG